MAEVRKFLDLDKLHLYHELSKRETDSQFSVVNAHIDDIAIYDNLPTYKNAIGVAKEGVTYYMAFPGDPVEYHALPYTDPDTHEIYEAPEIGDPVDHLYELAQEDKLTAGIVKKYVDEKFKSTLEGVVIYYPVYYVMERDPITGDLKPVYNYTEITEPGTIAEDGKTYYQKVGTGSTADPYRYEEVPVIPGTTIVTGLYLRDGQQTTIHPTEDEKEYPVIDPETGKQQMQAVTYIDDSTTNTIINTMAETATIPENEIIDLFTEEIN